MTEPVAAVSDTDSEDSKDGQDSAAVDEFQLDPAELRAAVLRRWDYLTKVKFTRALRLKGPVHDSTPRSPKEAERRRRRNKAQNRARRISRGSN